MAITQVVTSLPPSVDGVGDYALNLARQLRKDFGIETHFIVGDLNWAGATHIESFLISQMNMHSAPNLSSLLSRRQHSNVVLLHYVNYGYAKRGCPIWLVDGLQSWRTANENKLLVTMFHELYAFGPPWASSFWLSPVQRSLAARLARLSDRCLTSRQAYAETIQQLSRGKHTTVATLPVFCNIGEPAQLPSLAERTRRLVVFGHRNNRLLAYQQHLPTLAQICQALEIAEVCDIGVPTGLALSQINGIPIVEMGVTEATEISRILQDSIAGFLSSPSPEYLAKSTIFATYCAHNLIPVLISSSAAPMDGLKAGQHYWIANAQIEQLSLEVGQAIANNAYNWYHTHSLSAQAKVFAAQLNNPTDG